jgi:rhomboid protease GluP
MLSEIKDSSLLYWQKGKNLILDLDKLELPPELHSRDKKLIAYCDLRIESFQLIYKSIQDGPLKYKEQIQAYNYSIDSLLKTIK